MKNKKYIILFDALIVLLNIAAGRGNYLGNWLLSSNNSLYHVILIILLDLLYISNRLKTNSFKLTHKQKYIIPAIVFLLLLFYNFLNTSIQTGSFIQPSILYFFVALFTLFILNIQTNSIKDSVPRLTQRVFYISKGYIWLAMISVIGVILSFILFSIGIAKGYPITADFLSSNEDTGVTYMWTFMSVQNIFYFNNGLMDIRVPFFQDNGIFCGLFHEPHILAYNVLPCFILLLGFYKKMKQRVIIILFAIIMMLFAGSASNVLIVLILLVVYFLLQGRRHIIKAIIGASLIGLVVAAYISFDDTFFLFILDRLDGGNGSTDYAQDLLGYAFTPKTLFGGNFLSTKFMSDGVKAGEDIGFIPFLLNIAFIFFYIKNTYLLLHKKDSVSLAVGYASLYCILHSTKIAMTMYIQILPFFLVLLQSYILSNYGRVVIAKKN